MKFPAKCSRFTIISFLFASFLPLAGAQNNPPPQGPGRNNAGQIGLLRGALVERSQIQSMLIEFPGLLATPAAQKALGLSDEQRKKVEEIVFNIQRSLVQQEAALRVQQMDLDRLMQADSPDRGAVDKKITEISQAQIAVMRTRFNGLLDVQNVLTKEQREKLREFIQQRVRQGIRTGVAPAPPVRSVPPAPPSPPAPPVAPKPPAN